MSIKGTQAFGVRIPLVKEGDNLIQEIVNSYSEVGARNGNIRVTIEANKTSKQQALGTTPRKIVDLLGSLMDLVSGSGDKGTPVVVVRDYFKKYVD